MWADQGMSTTSQTSFTNNTARAGGVMWVEKATLNSHAANVTGNHANFGVVYLLGSTTLWLGIKLSDSLGSFISCIRECCDSHRQQHYGE